MLHDRYEINRRRVNDTRMANATTALLTAQITSLAIAHSGNTPPKQDIADYLAIEEILDKNDPVYLTIEYLGEKTKKYYEMLKENKEVSPTVFKAIDKHEVIGQALKRIKTDG